MVASVISAENIAWGAAEDPTGQSITIPGDCTKVLVVVSHYMGTGAGLLAITLDSNAPDDIFELVDSGVTRGVFAATWESPSTGSQTLDLVWNDGIVLGPNCTVVYIKDADTGQKDVDADADTGTTAVTVTLTTDVDDLVIKFDVHDSGPTPPALTSGWTAIETQAVGTEATRTSYIIATGGSTVCDAENESGSALVAVSFGPAGAPPVGGVLNKQILLGVG